MDPLDLLLVLAVLGLVVYFFLMSASDEMKPNDPEVAFDKDDPRVYGPSIAARGYTRWMDLMQRVGLPGRSKRAPGGKKDKRRRD